MKKWKAISAGLSLLYTLQRHLGHKEMQLISSNSTKWLLVFQGSHQSAAETFLCFTNTHVPPRSLKWQITIFCLWHQTRRKHLGTSKGTRQEENPSSEKHCGSYPFVPFQSTVFNVKYIFK